QSFCVEHWFVLSSTMAEQETLVRPAAPSSDSTANARSDGTTARAEEGNGRMRGPLPRILASVVSIGRQHREHGVVEPPAVAPLALARDALEAEADAADDR